MKERCWGGSLEGALSDTTWSGDAHGHIPVAVGSKHSWLAAGWVARCLAGCVTGCLAGLLFMFKVTKIDGQSFNVQKQVVALFDFAMSWSHVSAFWYICFQKDSCLTSPHKSMPNES